jgi:hypothetical protein
MTSDLEPNIYHSHKGLPALAGLATIAEASRPGLSVEACVARLKRFHYAFVRLHQILTARITAEPIYELKTGFSLHSYLCAEHVQALRNRIGEMREPPLGLETVPDPALETFFDEILAAPSTAELLIGLYEKALPALDAALARHVADTNPLADAPSVRMCRFDPNPSSTTRCHGATSDSETSTIRASMPRRFCTTASFRHARRH